MDPIQKFKDMQRQNWSCFTPFEAHTTIPAARLASFAKIAAGQKVLDVACGTGVVAVTAAARGARVAGLDLTPELLVRARENAAIAGVEVDWQEGDAENLPYPDASFDVVLSQFGHMFAPRPDVTLREMLRVLAPGGTIAFSTWPPELFIGRMFAFVCSQLPAPPPGIPSPGLWGEPGAVRERLGTAVRDLVFDRSTMFVPALSTAHFRTNAEQASGTVKSLVHALAGEPAKLAAFRKGYEDLAAQYFADNTVRQDFLMTRAVKA